MPSEAATLKRPRTASRETRRRQLIEATIASIAEQGISGTTMASVTGRAGLSMGIVSFHFQSKENLMQETLVHLVEEHRHSWVSALEEPGLLPAAKLRAVIDANFHPSICSKERISVWFAFFGEARYRAAYHERVAHFDTERLRTMAEICREIIDDGGYTGTDPADTAKAIECFSDGLWLSLMLYPDWLDPAAAKAQIYGYLASRFPRHFPAISGRAISEGRE